MEFGLQKTKKLESPALVGNPRKRVEAKAYRARDRMDSGWFRHDAGTPDHSPNVSPAASPLPLTGGRSKQFLDNVRTRCSCECDREQILKFPQHTVAAGVRSGPMHGGLSPGKVHLSGATARLQQQIYPSCSVWYRHEHTIVTSDTDEEQKKDKCHSPVQTWRHKDERDGGQYSPHSRRVCAEAEDYWKRNHDGSAKDWFRHEHTLLEQKENEYADVNAVGISPMAEFGSSATDPIITTDGHRCCICGGLNVSPAKTPNKKPCQQVLIERF